MRSIVPAAAALLLAACASTPKPVVEPVLPPTAAPRPSGSLIGQTANELTVRFGPPRLRVSEGVGTKLQFAATACILDAYLYPPPSGSGVARVTHVDTRSRDGRSVAQGACIAMIEAR